MNVKMAHNLHNITQHLYKNDPIKGTKFTKPQINNPPKQTRKGSNVDAPMPSAYEEHTCIIDLEELLQLAILEYPVSSFCSPEVGIRAHRAKPCTKYVYVVPIFAVQY